MSEVGTPPHHNLCILHGPVASNTHTHTFPSDRQITVHPFFVKQVNAVVFSLDNNRFPKLSYPLIHYQFKNLCANNYLIA